MSQVDSIVLIVDRDPAFVHLMAPVGMAMRLRTVGLPDFPGEHDEPPHARLVACVMAEMQQDIDSLADRLAQAYPKAPVILTVPSCPTAEQQAIGSRLGSLVWSKQAGAFGLPDLIRLAVHEHQQRIQREQQTTLAEQERERIRRTILLSDTRSEAASSLGISIDSLRRKMRSHGLEWRSRG